MTNTPLQIEQALNQLNIEDQAKPCDLNQHARTRLNQAKALIAERDRLAKLAAKA